MDVVKHIQYDDKEESIPARDEGSMTLVDEDYEERSETLPDGDVEFDDEYDEEGCGDVSSSSEENYQIFAGVTTLRRRWDNEYDSNSESSSDSEDEEDDREAVTTYSIDQGEPFGPRRIEELEYELLDARERLDAAKRVYDEWKDKYWAVRDDYRLSHRTLPDPIVPELSHEPDLGCTPARDPEKAAEEDTWMKIRSTELQFLTLETEVESALEDVLGAHAELLICTLNTDPQRPKAWSFDDGLAVRTWDPREDVDGTRADAFRCSPEAERALVYEGRRYN
ncbi:hypothetical protein BJ170DRAFT_688261 [Xylariales sp. AK1849]|nr:hypothetical protein BJ170DRAFT_688261 [Xylariales sp. AK1849]